MKDWKCWVSSILAVMALHAYQSHRFVALTLMIFALVLADLHGETRADAAVTREREAEAVENVQMEQR